MADSFLFYYKERLAEGDPYNRRPAEIHEDFPTWHSETVEENGGAWEVGATAIQVESQSLRR